MSSAKPTCVHTAASVPAARASSPSADASEVERVRRLLDLEGAGLSIERLRGMLDSRGDELEVRLFDGLEHRRHVLAEHRHHRQKLLLVEAAVARRVEARLGEEVADARLLLLHVLLEPHEHAVRARRLGRLEPLRERVVVLDAVLHQIAQHIDQDLSLIHI